MAAKWLGHAVMDDGLDSGLAQVTTLRIMVISAYALADSYATVASNDLGFNDSSGAAEVTLSTVSNNRRATIRGQNTTNGNAITATGTDAAPDLHIALLDTTNTEVLAIIEVDPDQAITTGNDINVPDMTIDIEQPT